MTFDDLKRIAYSQGWITNQIELLQPKDETENVLIGQWREMWKSLNDDIDVLVEESQELMILKDKLQQIKDLSGRNPLEDKLDSIKNIIG